MVRQARLIASWGDNVYVKIPVTNTQGVSSDGVIRELSADGVQLNVTALMTTAQVEAVAAALRGRPRPRRLGLRRPDRRHRPRPDAADDRGARRCWPHDPKLELLWASPREVLNIAPGRARSACHIITVTHDLLAKLTVLRQGPRPVLARDRADVPRRRGRLPATRCERRAGAGSTPTGPTRTTGTTTGTSTARPPRATRPTTTATRMVLKLLGDRCPRARACSTSAAARASSPSTCSAADPQAAVFGVEYSAEGVAPGQRRSPSARASRRTFYERNLLRAGDPRPQGSRRRPTRSAPRCSSTSTTRSR